MVKFTCWCTMGETKKNFFKISKILPTSNPFLKIEIHIELTYRWNPYFFTKNDKISLIFPIVEKSKFYFPPPLIRVFNLTFFFKTRGLSMGKNENSCYRRLRVNCRWVDAFPIRFKNKKLDNLNLSCDFCYVVFQIFFLHMLAMYKIDKVKI